MHSDESSCIEGLYDVLTDATLLPAAVSNIRTFLGGTAATMFIVDRCARMLSFTPVGTDPAWISPFIEHFSAIDPTRPFVEHAAPGQWFTQDDLLHPALSTNLEYVNDFARPAGVRWLRGGKIMQDQNGAAFLTVHKPADARPFDSEVIERLDRLFPHLQRVSRLLLRMPGPLSALAEAEEGIRRLAAGVLVVDVDGGVRYANPFALDLMRKGSGLRLKGGRIQLDAVAAQEKLRRSFVLACHSPRQASSFAVASAGNALQIRVVPIAITHPLAGSSHDPRALVFFAEAPPRLSARELAQIHGFTEAEAELVVLLGKGLSPNDCAGKRGVKMPTIRSQLSSVLQKTGASSLPQLLSIIFSLPPVVD